MRQFVSPKTHSQPLRFLVKRLECEENVKRNVSSSVIDYYSGMYFNVIESLLGNRFPGVFFRKVVFHVKVIKQRYQKADAVPRWADTREPSSKFSIAIELENLDLRLLLHENWITTVSRATFSIQIAQEFVDDDDDSNGVVCVFSAAFYSAQNLFEKSRFKIYVLIHFRLLHPERAPTRGRLTQFRMTTKQNMGKFLRCYHIYRCYRHRSHSHETEFH